MPLKIKINNLNKKRGIGNDIIKKAAFLVLNDYGIREALIDITFLTDSRIKNLNKKYMRKDRPTDVLSFSLNGGVSKKNQTLIGDIYISSDTAYRNSVKFKTNFREELMRYVIHGVLHLLGFRDSPTAEKIRMRDLEEKFLKRIH